jgi:hypothetical protein
MRLAPTRPARTVRTCTIFETRATPAPSRPVKAPPVRRRPARTSPRSATGLFGSGKPARRTLPGLRNAGRLPRLTGESGPPGRA